MTNLKSSITILICSEAGKRATKKFSMQADGSIEKTSFSAGTFFKYETKPISNLKDLANVLEDLLDEPTKFVIRGKIKPGMPKVVRRKVYEPGAAFDSVPRPYIMLDIDKQPCPDYFDPSQRPEEIVAWVQQILPEPFRDVTCYYKFSSSQDVYSAEKGKKTVSMHLWYYLDKEVSDEEWKRYFKSVSSPVDEALFSAVQPHYTARPVFDNMSDPLPRRSSIFSGLRDLVMVPKMPKMPVKTRVKRSLEEPSVSDEDKGKALEFLVPYYKEGTRNRLCGALAATLYRGGWIAENAADFVYRLAESVSDSEGSERYDNALRICDVVDKDLPAQGIPVLKDELGIADLDHILNLLGVGKPDIDSVIGKLSNLSTIPDIKEVLKILLSFPDTQRKFYLDRMSKQTSFKKGSLQSLLQEVISEEFDLGPQDLADSLMETLLAIEYQEGQHLLYTSDNSYFHYTGSHWRKIPEQQIKKTLLPHARELIAEIERGSVTNFNNAVLNILEGRAYRQDDPLRQIDQDPPAVINCQNGELWFDEDGDVSLRPHRPESYLRHCLNVEYDPSAKAPMFEEAVLEIFSNSSDPKDMFRHFMEMAGYICQPWRKLANIILLHGGGSNGKTSLVKIIGRMLGENTVMSDRISDIEGNVFKIGDLDGKLMLLDDDVDGGTCLPDGFLKKISEEKAMTGQHKHKPPFEFICRAVPVMLANDYPVTSDLTKGLRRRLMAVPFKRTFEPHEIEPGLFDAIWEAESSGILNHVVAGFSRLKKRGRFEEPEDCIKAKKEWIIRANVLTTFIDEMCETGENYNIYLGDFYKAFDSYCRDTGVKNIQSLKGVRSRLESLGYRIGMLNGKRAVWGIRLTTPGLVAKLEPKL
jgi:P4 family phage/plasmid primase-like protien